MSITTAICNSFKQEILQGIHLAADTYKIALYSSAATLNKATTAYSATNEVSGTGYTAGGKALSGFATSLDSDTAILDFDDPSWTSATITAAGALIYNSTRSNKAVASFSFGGDISSTNGTFTAQIPAAAAATGLVRIA
jgi:hypothetical protein